RGGPGPQRGRDPGAAGGIGGSLGMPGHPAGGFLSTGQPATELRSPVGRGASPAMIAHTRKGRERLGAFSIMSMSLEDIPGVVEIENLSFPTPWSESSFRYELLENPYASLFVARSREGAMVLAFACVWVIDQEV